jgi:hypothetical protein
MRCDKSFWGCGSMEADALGGTPWCLAACSAPETAGAPYRRAACPASAASARALQQRQRARPAAPGPQQPQQPGRAGGCAAEAAPSAAACLGRGYGRPRPRCPAKARRSLPAPFKTRIPQCLAAGVTQAAATVYASAAPPRAAAGRLYEPLPADGGVRAAVWRARAAPAQQCRCEQAGNGGAPAPEQHCL